MYVVNVVADARRLRQFLGSSVSHGGVALSVFIRFLLALKALRAAFVFFQALLAARRSSRFSDICLAL